MAVRHVTDKQAQFLIEREMENCSSASKVKAENKDNPFDIKKVSALVIYQNEQSGDLSMQLEIKEARKRTNTEERPEYDTYVITGKQLDAMCQDAESKSKMYDLLSKYKENDDVYACYGDEFSPKRYEQYKGSAFGVDVKPNNMDNYTPTSYLDKCSYSLSEVCEQNKTSFTREHPKENIIWHIEKYNIDPKYAMEKGSYTSEDFEAIYQATGIKPVVIGVGREVLDHDEPQGPSERYAYITGFKMTAQLYLGDVKAPQNIRNMVNQESYKSDNRKVSSNIDLVNYYMGQGRVDHSLIIGPDYLTTLMSKSSFKFDDQDKTKATGVTEASVYETKHAYTHGSYNKKESSPSQDDIMNAFTNDSVDRVYRQSIRPQAILSTPPHRGFVYTLEIDTAKRPSNVEITDENIKNHRQKAAIYLSAAKKHNESVTAKGKIKQANHTGNSVSQISFDDDELPFN